MSEQRDEICAILAAHHGTMSAAQLFEKAKSHDDRAAFSVMISTMAKDGEIAKYPAPAGFGSGVRFVYGSIGGEPPSAEAPPRPPAPALAKRKKAQRKAPPPASKKGKTPRTRTVVVLPPLPPGPPPRWALTSDGAFMLLGTEVEIARPAAHALVAFIDVLRQGAA